ncbi:MAG: aminoacyl-tRNA deacylase [Candidatus Thermofonsia bacterium]|nr:MAG: aminoacyl-tRNA deacylase [Candidatus Thermofonsia bacterium]
MTEKTLAMKLLEGKRVPYETAVYPTTIRDAQEVAKAIGANPAQVFKTLVVLPPEEKGPKAKPILYVLPAHHQLNLKKLAKAVGAKKVKMAAHTQAESLTGLQVGGISPLALLNKGFAVYLDEAAKSQETIYISAGERGRQIKLAVKDLVKLTRAKFAAASDPAAE